MQPWSKMFLLVLLLALQLTGYYARPVSNKRRIHVHKRSIHSVNKEADEPVHLVKRGLYLTGKPIQKSSKAYRDGVATRYWDACKPSCSWPGKGPFSTPVVNCKKDGSLLPDQNAPGACQPATPNAAPPGNAAFVCDNQVPWEGDQYTAYGFVAAPTDELKESDICCSCYELLFKDKNKQGAPQPQLVGKRMIVQANNIGQPGELNKGHFDMTLPGGGKGFFTAAVPAQIGNDIKVLLVNRRIFMLNY